MAVVQGIKEKVHLPIYDCFTVKSGEQLGDVPEASNSNVLKFFINVQGKTKLQTNLQSASLLPHYNTFEARALRVVISDLPPEFSDDLDLEVTGELDLPNNDGVSGTVSRTLKTDLQRAMQLLDEARESEDGTAITEVDISGVADSEDAVYPEAGEDTAPEDLREFEITTADLEAAIGGLGRKAPPREQIRPDNGAGTIIAKFIYNTVATLYVGEKVMIQMPTWFFPAGAGPYSESSHFTTHGQPDPMATFRFAEPVYIDKQQNFRFELEIPDSDVQRQFRQIYGPLSIWVVLDGFMIRNVQ